MIGKSFVLCNWRSCSGGESVSDNCGEPAFMTVTGDDAVGVIGVCQPSLLCAEPAGASARPGFNGTEFTGEPMVFQTESGLNA